MFIEKCVTETCLHSHLLTEISVISRLDFGSFIVSFLLVSGPVSR